MPQLSVSRPESTIGEWLQQPEAGAALLAAMGDFGATFDPEAEDSADAAFLLRVLLMRMSEDLSLEDLDELVAQYG